ncbi:MAG TPA: hypothetical protein VFB82_04645 [Blastocatellia bacterium]|nr:hypothetical protein [Blastocatellia bacterium]
MKHFQQCRSYLRALVLVCVVLSLPSLRGGLVSSSSINGDQPLSRRILSAVDLPSDAIAARGQSFSLKLFKNLRPQLDLAIAGTAPKVVVPAARIARALTSISRTASAAASLPTGRAPPQLG